MDIIEFDGMKDNKVEITKMGIQKLRKRDME